MFTKPMYVLTEQNYMVIYKMRVYSDLEGGGTAPKFLPHSNPTPSNLCCILVQTLSSNDAIFIKSLSWFKVLDSFSTHSPVPCTRGPL